MIPQEVVDIAEELAKYYEGEDSGDMYDMYLDVAYRIYNRLQQDDDRLRGYVNQD